LALSYRALRHQQEPLSTPGPMVVLSKRLIGTPQRSIAQRRSELNHIIFSG
jgi:hypothetical protein